MSIIIDSTVIDDVNFAGIGNKVAASSGAANIVSGLIYHAHGFVSDFYVSSYNVIKFTSVDFDELKTEWINLYLNGMRLVVSSSSSDLCDGTYVFDSGSGELTFTLSSVPDSGNQRVIINIIA